MMLCSSRLSTKSEGIVEGVFPHPASVVSHRNYDKVLWQKRETLARIASALLVQRKGLGLALVTAR